MVEGPRPRCFSRKGAKAQRRRGAEDAGAPEERPAPAEAGGDVSIPQEAFIAALRMGEE
ncbi:hypothetical protein ERY430_70036 [Erythrobacter sp. EC-HK427]|nr:hypothetical protein ERY430_70036 [Erythrobacter sp. EC-HK427]